MWLPCVVSVGKVDVLRTCSPKHCSNPAFRTGTHASISSTFHMLTHSQVCIRVCVQTP
ncbi:hypothetical protein M422DRAFT_36486 [Sphaerobolus stellatus SS14]|uniref:Uncharacterized protein n=1 Tax=Sphaerobolus stellatus (strain SS14) TaxID=990650 RepID=A0A0C9U8A0_SPHS4|nr:hypothetical protein M422DRAFT_36486 [Sphaerobolus stellatus SS14]